MTRFGVPTRGACPLCGASAPEPVRPRSVEAIMDLVNVIIHDTEAYAAGLADRLAVVEAERDALIAARTSGNGDE